MPDPDGPPDASYEDIVSRYQSGEIGRDELFSVLFDRYYSTLVAYGHRLGLSEEESRDLAQESFVRIYRYVDQLDARSSLRAVLLTTFRNLAFNDARATAASKRKVIVVPESELADVATSEVSADNALIAKTQLAQLREAMVSALTPDEAALLMSLYVEERSHAEIAETLGVSPNVVRVRMHRAQQKLHRYIVLLCQIRPLSEGRLPVKYGRHDAQRTSENHVEKGRNRMATHFGELLATFVVSPIDSPFYSMV